MEKKTVPKVAKKGLVFGIFLLFLFSGIKYLLPFTREDCYSFSYSIGGSSRTPFSERLNFIYPEEWNDISEGSKIMFSYIGDETYFLWINSTEMSYLVSISFKLDEIVTSHNYQEALYNDGMQTGYFTTRLHFTLTRDLPDHYIGLWTIAAIFLFIYLEYDLLNITVKGLVKKIDESKKRS